MVEPAAQGLSESLENLREAIALIESVARGSPKPASIAVQLAVAQEFAGRRLQSLGQTSAAAEQYQKSMATVGPCAAVQSGFAYCVQQLFADEEALALLYADAGTHSAARVFADSALVRAQAFADGDQKSERRIGHLAKAYFVLASVSRAAGDRKQLREAAGRAVSLWSSVHDPSVLTLHRQAKEEAEAMLRETAGSDP
jgi:tetratricopeptide (TPR) repeat protein